MTQVTGSPAPLRVVMLGCGDIATTGHLPAVERSADVRLVGVVDPVDGNRERAASRYRTPGFAELAAATTTAADAVLIATPPEVAPYLTVDAVELGLDVLCEKPMAVDIDSAERVRRAARASGRIVQIGFKNRFSPLVRTLRDWIRQGRLGSPVVFTIGGFDETLDPTDTTHLRRITHFLEHAPAFVHEGAHLADHLAFLTGSRPERVRAVGLRSAADLPSENFASALVSYANGDVARLEVGWLFPTSPKGEFRALGPDGVAVLDRPAGEITLTTRDKAESVRLDRPWNDLCFDAQLAHFVDCVRRRVEPETSVDAGIASLRLTDAVARAMRTSRVVRC